MSTEIYSLALDFAGGLNNIQLKDEINADVSITPTCTDIRTNGDVVNIDFDAALSGAEQTALDALVAAYVYTAPVSNIMCDIFTMSNITDKFVRLDQTAKSITFGSEKTLDGTWTSTTGNLSGFNLSTGLFSVPQNGIYFYNLSVKISATGINTWLKLNVKDEGDAIVFGSYSPIITASSNYYTFMGNGEYLQNTNERYFTIECDLANITVDLIIKIVQLFGS